MNNSMVETAIGAIVVAIATGFFMFMYTVGGLGGHSSGYQVSASFGTVKGVSVGTDVRMAGIKIGSVTAQTLDRDTYRATIVMDVDATVKLPEDSTAKIASESLLGGNFVSLEPGGSDTMIESGGEIAFTQDPVDIFGLVSQFVLGNNNKSSGSGSSETAEEPATEDSTAEEPAAEEVQVPVEEAPAGEAPAPEQTGQPAQGTTTQ